MKNLDVKQLDETDEEIADALIILGMGRPVARALAYLQNAGEATSLELERGTGLRQPEVSIAMEQLEQRNWIKWWEEKKQGKGRPFKVYSLKIGFDEIIAEFEKQQKRDVEETKAKIERLKELGIS